MPLSPTIYSPMLPDSKDKPVFTRCLSGWRYGLTCMAGWLALTLAINISFAVYAVKSFPVTNGIGTWGHGSCDQMAKLNTWIQLGVNVLSSAMLGSSSYCMQRLCAPTRREVDQAHARGEWLDIGILSLRNLKKINRFRVAIWVVLALSSVPLHLLYNSAVFQEIGVSRYSVVPVQEAFFNASSEDISDPYYRQYRSSPNDRNNSLVRLPTPVLNDLQEVLWLRDNQSKLQRLEIPQCLKTYAKSFVTQNSDVLLVLSPGQNATRLVIHRHTIAPNYEYSSHWMCDPDNYYHCLTSEALSRTTLRIKSLETDARGNFYEPTWDIAYCLSLPVPERCQLKFSVGILAAVITCNLIKIICLVVTIRKLNEPTLVTLGDAINSFLQEPDCTTINLCPHSRNDLKRSNWKNLADPTRSFPNGPRKWDFSRHLWFRSASRSRWLWTNALCFAGIAVPLILAGRSKKLKNFKIISDFGFGEASTSTLINATKKLSLGSNIMLANLPQLLLSVFYFMYNGVFTCELINAEWTNYFMTKKPLRVTLPRGDQISSYYLNLPYIYSVTLLVVSMILHWLFSRALFLVDVTTYDYLGRGRAARLLEYPLDQDDCFTQCGFSPLAVIISAIVAGLFVVVGVLNGFRRYRGGMPLGATCSASISAACHPRSDEVPDLAFGPVQWGVVSKNPETGVEHLAFSGRDVSLPDESGWYMGGFTPSEERDDDREFRNVWFSFGWHTQRSENQCQGQWSLEDQNIRRR